MRQHRSHHGSRRGSSKLGAVGAALLLVGCAHTETSKLAWPVTPNAVGPTPHVQAVALVQDVRAPVQTLHFAWPLAATAVSSLFGSRQDPIFHGTRFHAGVDLVANYGAVVRTVAQGRVRYAGRDGGYGRQVCVEHRGGFATCYAHLATLLVATGAWLRPGAPLGLLGNSGRSTGPHLHLDVRKDGNFVDPLQVLGETVVLSP